MNLSYLELVRTLLSVGLAIAGGESVLDGFRVEWRAAGGGGIVPGAAGSARTPPGDGVVR